MMSLAPYQSFPVPSLLMLPYTGGCRMDVVSFVEIVFYWSGLGYFLRVKNKTISFQVMRCMP